METAGDAVAAVVVALLLGGWVLYAIRNVVFDVRRRGWFGRRSSNGGGDGASRAYEVREHG